MLVWAQSAEAQQVWFAKQRQRCGFRQIDFRVALEPSNLMTP